MTIALATNGVISKGNKDYPAVGNVNLNTSYAFGTLVGTLAATTNYYNNITMVVDSNELTMTVD